MDGRTTAVLISNAKHVDNTKQVHRARNIDSSSNLIGRSRRSEIRGPVRLAVAFLRISFCSSFSTNSKASTVAGLRRRL